MDVQRCVAKVGEPFAMTECELPCVYLTTELAREIYGPDAVSGWRHVEHQRADHHAVPESFVRTVPADWRNCLVCGTDMAADVPTGTGEYLFQIMRRQTDAGICDRCQSARQRAAVDYMRAADAVRVMVQMGADYPLTARRMPAHKAFAQAIRQIQDADRRCVALKMWPATR